MTQSTRTLEEIRTELAHAEAAEQQRAQHAAEQQAAAELEHARRVWAGWEALDDKLKDEEQSAGRDQIAAGEAADLLAAIDAVARMARARAARKAVRDNATAALSLITEADARKARAAAAPGQEADAEARSRTRQPTPPGELRTREYDIFDAFVSALTKRAEMDGYGYGDDLIDRMKG